MNKNTTPARRSPEVVQTLLQCSVDGDERSPGAHQIAKQYLADYGSPEAAVRIVVDRYTTTVSTSGFAKSLPDMRAIPVSMWADIAPFEIQAVQCVAVIACLRGRDVSSHEVRSHIETIAIGSAGVEVAAKTGVNLARHAVTTAVFRMRDLQVAIDRAAGSRTPKSLGSANAINLCHVVDFVGALVAAGVYGQAMRMIARHAMTTFPVLPGTA